MVAVALLAGCRSHGPFTPVDWHIDGRAPHVTVQGEDALARDGASPDLAPLQLPEGPLVLSVEQAVVLAMQHNRALRIEQLQPLIVGQFEQLERAVFDPVFDAGGDFTRVVRREPALPPGTTTTESAERIGLDGGLRQQLPTGTAVDLGLSQEHLRFSDDDEEDFARVGLTFTQALLRGGDVRANLVGIEQARLDTVISRYELQGFTEALVAEVEQTYWDLVLLQREIELVERSLELAETQKDHVQRRIEAGTIAGTELAAAQAEVALREEALISARVDLQIRRLEFIRLLNPVNTDQWEHPLELLDAPTELEVLLDDVDTHVAVAEQMRTDLNEARLRWEQGRLEVVRTRNGLLPRLDLFITLGKTGFAESFGSAWRDLDGPGYDVSVGARFEHAIGNRAARARHAIARTTRRQFAEAIENTRQIVQLDVRVAFLEVQRFRQQIAATRATRELREATLRAEVAKFDAGTTTALLVAQAQRDLLESQIAEVRAIIAHRQALIDLYRLEGTLLLRRGLAVASGEK